MGCLRAMELGVRQMFLRRDQLCGIECRLVKVDSGWTLDIYIKHKSTYVLQLTVQMKEGFFLSIPPHPHLLPVPFFSQGNNQTHGHGSHRSRVSPYNPSPVVLCLILGLAMPLLLLCCVFFFLKMEE